MTGDEIPAELVGRLVAEKVWTRGEAVAHAERVREPVALVEVLVVLGLVERALAVAATVDDLLAAARMWEVLAPALPAQLMPDALRVVEALPDEGARGEALAAVAPHVPAELGGLLLHQATAMPDEADRAFALGRVAPHLPADLVPDAFTAAFAIDEDCWRTWALHLLAAAPPPGLLHHLPYDRQRQVVTELVTAGLAAAGDDMAVHEEVTAWWRELFAELLPAGLLPDVLAAMDGVAEEWAVAFLLSTVAARLPAELADRAVRLASALTEPARRAHALTALGPRVPDRLRLPVYSAAGEAAAAIAGDEDRARAVRELAPQAPAEVYATLRVAAATISDQGLRTRTLIALGPHHPEPGRSQAVAESLAAATALEDAIDRRFAVAGLCRYLPDDLIRQVQASAAAAGDSEVLKALAPHLPADLVPSGWAAALGLAGDGDRSAVLARLVPLLPVAMIPGAFATAAALPAVMARTGGCPRHEVLRALAPRLPGDLIPAAVVALAPATVLSAPPESRRELDVTLAELVARLAPEHRDRALRDALHAVAALDSGWARAEALTRLVPHLPASLLPAALAAARAIVGREPRTEVLTELVHRLPADLLPDLVDAF
jgi:hypothetical protein